MRTRAERMIVSSPGGLHQSDVLQGTAGQPAVPPASPIAIDCDEAAREVALVLKSLGATPIRPVPDVEPEPPEG